MIMLLVWLYEYVQDEKLCRICNPCIKEKEQGSISQLHKIASCFAHFSQLQYKID
jgi:hypothetical protein